VSGVKHLFFDLDGTLTHSQEGIINCINYALVDAGLGVQTAADLRPFLGPPLRESFATLLQTGEPDRVDRAIAAYRSRFEATGMFENAVYPGIREALNALSFADFALHVVTAKPTVYAQRILEHFTLEGFFRSVNGSELAGRGYNKTSLIRDALAASGAEPAATAMIGDRGEDITGARANDVLGIAVAWGYGDRAEFQAAGADLVVESPEELVRHLQDHRYVK
jgi:phosphoglycolate phosphatase